ncbi:MAG: hypothetical protein QOE41_2182, partial [Mycobacterium sp.]|nr:hypothetical protein [Mycobacterium sp.]
LVAAVEAGTAADVAGLRRGDLIVAMDNRPALSEVVFAERVEELSEAEGLNLTVLRGNAQRDVEIRRPKSHG